MGGADLLSSVIVPIIVRALDNLRQKLPEARKEELLDKLIKAEVEKTTEEMVRRTRSSKAKQKSKALKRAVTAEIAMFIERGDIRLSETSLRIIQEASSEQKQESGEQKPNGF
jgi:hypothetical protein